MIDGSDSQLPVPRRQLKLDTLVRLRWLAIAGQLASVIVVYFGLGYPLPIGPALALIALSAWINVYLKLRSPSTTLLSNQAATLQLAYDIVQLTGLIFLTGGLGNPFVFLLLAPVMVSATGLSAKNTIYLGVLATITATFLGIYHLSLPWPQTSAISLPLTYIVGIWVSLVISLAFMGIYAFQVAEEARRLSDALTASDLVLAREQHLNALDGLAAAAAHELGTPLATIVLTAKELTSEFEEGDPRGEDVALISSQSLRCRDILRKLTSLSSDRDQLFQRMPMSQLIEETVAPNRNVGVKINVNMSGEGPEPVGVRNPGIRYGLGNIIENAVDFAESEVNVTTAWDDKTVQIAFIDDGPGFSPEVLARLGDPYISVRSGRHNRKDSSGGLGLGFFIAKTLLERTGAKLSLENRKAPEKGAIVRVTWPRSAIKSTVDMDQETNSIHKN